MKGAIGLRVGVSAFALAAMTAVAAAQQASPSRPNSEPTRAERAPAPPSSTRPANASPKPILPEVEELPVRSGAPATAAKPVPAIKDPGFGRVPIDNFSVGLEMDRKLHSDKFPDGRQLPGLESRRRENQSPFVGFSVSIPTQ